MPVIQTIVENNINEIIILFFSFFIKKYNNSHIVKNVEPYSLVGGNPGKFIKYRFTKEQIEKLLEIKWWYWDDAKINKFAPLLCNENIDHFIETALKE